MDKEEHFKTETRGNGSLKEFHSKTWDAAIASSKPEKPWPQRKDNYLFENSAGEILVEMFYPESPVDKYRLLTGNCYRTKRDLINEQNRKVLKAKILKMLKEKNGDWIPDYEDAAQDKFELHWSHTGNCLLVMRCHIQQSSKHVARSREIWREIIDKLGENEVAEAMEVI